ncbi:hypothetical protein ANCCAN_21137 [Ancylostoma caninum]|uniref:Uncharacterized protein n=1 Tax=Ancylostoma caninum TaxID=29170 RepID=A0A368FLI4_ANCCA|nr:hypothetical protein ANCCAN_21137 [Ancylostoma caninum]
MAVYDYWPLKIIKCVQITLSVSAAITLNFTTSYFTTVSEFVVVIGYSVLCSMISLYIRLVRKYSGRVSQMATLHKKFQDKENGRTMPIYTFILINELASSTITFVSIALFQKLEVPDEEMVEDLMVILILIISYRVLFINSITLYNCYLWRRMQKKCPINHYANGEDHFKQLQSSWEAADVNDHRCS